MEERGGGGEGSILDKAFPTPISQEESRHQVLIYLIQGFFWTSLLAWLRSHPRDLVDVRDDELKYHSN